MTDYGAYGQEPEGMSITAKCICGSTINTVVMVSDEDGEFVPVLEFVDVTNVWLKKHLHHIYVIGKDKFEIKSLKVGRRDE
jgi:hypothetical protein